MRTVLFVCTGNTCRSPMAEAIARHTLDSGQIPGGASIFVASAGIHAGDGLPISPETMHTLRARGIRHDGHAKQLTAEMIRRADLVFAMTEAHRAGALRLVEGEPEHAAKVLRIDEAGDIEDPIGQGQSAYDAVAERLARLLPRRLAETLAPLRRAERRADAGTA